MHNCYKLICEFRFVNDESGMAEKVKIMQNKKVSDNKMEGNHTLNACGFRGCTYLCWNNDNRLIFVSGSNRHRLTHNTLCSHRSRLHDVYHHKL